MRGPVLAEVHTPHGGCLAARLSAAQRRPGVGRGRCQVVEAVGWAHRSPCGIRTPARGALHGTVARHLVASAYPTETNGPSMRPRRGQRPRGEASGPCVAADGGQRSAGQDTQDVRFGARDTLRYCAESCWQPLCRDTVCCSVPPCAGIGVSGIHARVSSRIRLVPTHLLHSGLWSGRGDNLFDGPHDDPIRAAAARKTIWDQSCVFVSSVVLGLRV